MLLMPNMPEVATYAPRATPQPIVRAAVEPSRESFSAVLDGASRTEVRDTAREVEPSRASPVDDDALTTPEVATDGAESVVAQAGEDATAEGESDPVAEAAPDEPGGDSDASPILTDVHVKIEVEVVSPIDLGGLVAETAPAPTASTGTAAAGGTVSGEMVVAQLAGTAVELVEAAIEALAGGDEAPASPKPPTAPVAQAPAIPEAGVADTLAQAVAGSQGVLNAAAVGDANAPKPQAPFAPQAKATVVAEPVAPVAAEMAPQGAVQPVNTAADQQATDQQQLPTPQPQVSEAKPAAPAPSAMPTTNPVATAAAPAPAPDSAPIANNGTQNAPGMPQTPELDDAARVNEARISRGLQNAVHQGGGSITLRLTPAELGTVRIQMQLMGTSVSADIHTETEAARATLSGQITQLRQALESQGLSVDRLNVQSMSTSSSQPQQFSQSDQGTDGRSRGFMGQEGRQREGSSQGQQDGSGGRRQRFEEALLGQAA